jgi:2,4-dienoyl-CoA reductase-like NADH-dependent reductase (Old Yellow Enzyme family)
MSSKLFAPLSIGSMALANRVTVAPMCQYSAIDGTMTDWHLMHLGTLAISGAAMLVIEGRRRAKAATVSTKIIR